MQSQPKHDADTLVYHRNTCRLCESPNVELAVKLTACPPVDAFVTADRLNEPQQPFPLDLYLCHACGHAQLLDVVSPKLLFGSYIYTTSSSPGLVDYFGAYADEVLAFVKPAKGGLAADIGSNDGTLLRFFKERGLKVLGIDPAESIAAAATASGVETVPDFFTSKLGTKLRQERGPFSLVTANNVFAHSDALGDMADGVGTLLAPDGVFVCEVSYMLDMIKNMVFDFIYHEHLSHHAVKPMQTFLKRHGLELFHVQRTPSKGGTLRCYAQLIGGPRRMEPSVADMLKLEDDFALYQLGTYQAYSRKIESAHARLDAALAALPKGTTLGGYGASATGTVLTYHYNLGDRMKFLIDDNPVRQGRFSPGHHIPVVASDILQRDPPGAVIILVWRFADMIIKKNQAYLDKGGKFIVPLPELRVL